MIALISVLAGALAGPLVGALVASAGGGVFYLTVGGRGSVSTLTTTVMSTAIWVAAGLLSGFLAKTLSEQGERRRAAAVALVRADAAREAQLVEQARVEELAAGLQLQTENLQAAGEELSAQRDELRSQNEQLSAERDENARPLERERVAVSMSAALAEVDRAIHSSLEVAQVVQTALREGAEVIGAETAGVSLHEDEAKRFRVAYIHNYPPDKLGVLIPDENDTHGVEAMRTGRTLAINDTHDDPRVVAELMDAWNIKSVICAPLVVRGRPIAVAYFNCHSASHRFSEREVEFVTKLASSLSTALENAMLFEAQEDELSRTATLREIAAAAAGTIDQRELSAQVLDACRRRLGAKAGNVYVIDRKAGLLRASALFGFPEALMPQMEQMDLDEARASARSYLKREVVTHDSSDLPHGISERAKAAEATQDRWVSLPIRARDEVVGSFGLIFPGQRPFGAEELALYQALADQLGVGLDKARLFEAEAEARQEAAQELATTGFLLEAAAELNRRTDLGGTLSALADIALRATPHARVSIGLLAADRSQVTFAATAGKEPMPAGTVVPWNGVSSALREALSEGKTRIADYDLLPEEQRGTAVPVASRLALLVPLVFDDRTVGHIGLDDREERREFTEREIEIIESIAALAATAIENARLSRGAAAHRHDAPGELHPRAAQGRRPRARAWSHKRPTRPTLSAVTSAMCSSSTTPTSSR